MSMALRRVPGLLKKTRSWSNTLKSMAMAAGEHSQNLQDLIDAARAAGSDGPTT
ncbi:hypothetical protein BHE74_00053604 [Ensete ventricosum]|uniref:Uncharacterized protein n=1 Tax=Ensete ventricosum TaxID=4639 RepID=A0A427A797_ENSVE|nr:hypothetical protein B296_00011561 [Ensete ventricosum]RWW40946.1 hypothetical protein BHE74_00053604 [Ensete ventricosum]RZR88498.1 hypothetical protein BHM03_00016081 [Ensete ventricosum]